VTPTIRARVTPLREAQRELTRERIRSSARELFAEQGFQATTMDEIATEAGLTRSTLYQHYKDKSEILADIFDDYRPRAVAQMERLPGPMPSPAQIGAWMEDLTDFHAREREPLTIMRQTSGADSAALIEDLHTQLLQALARQIPAFKGALASSKARLEARVRADLLIGELTIACSFASRQRGTPYAKALIKIVGENLRQYILDHSRT